MTILKNAFHNTTYRTRFTRDELDAIVYRIQSGHDKPKDRRFVAKVRGKLCGTTDCKCARTAYGEF